MVEDTFSDDLSARCAESFTIAALSSDPVAAQTIIRLALVAISREAKLEEKEQEIEALEAELESIRDDQEAAAENIRLRLRLMDKVRAGLEGHLDELELV